MAIRHEDFDRGLGLCELQNAGNGMLEPLESENRNNFIQRALGLLS